jgi:phosphatidylglycerophosphate synthase
LLSEWFGHILDKPLAPLARRLPFSPNSISIAGLFVTAAASAFIPLDLLIGGFLIAVGGFFDILDGLVARINRKRSIFGAFLDSTLDRYSDSMIIIGASWYFFAAGDMTGVAVSVCGLVGSLATSYARARAEGLGLDCKVGILERPERVLLIALGCITGLLFPAMLIIAVLSHLTVLQRIVHVYSQLRKRE